MTQIEDKYRLIFEQTILGSPPRKSNSRQLVYRSTADGKKPLIIKSSKALKYVEDFCTQVPSACKVKWVEKLRLDAWIFYANVRSDLSSEMIMDCLQTAEVIKNDNQIVEQHLYKHRDTKNPRAIIKLYIIKDYIL